MSAIAVVPAVWAGLAAVLATVLALAIASLILVRAVASLSGRMESHAEDLRTMVARITDDAAAGAAELDRVRDPARRRGRRF